MLDLKKGQEVELQIDELAYGGKGLSRFNNFVIFIEKAIPGQKVLAYITKKKKDFAEAKIKKIISESSFHRSSALIFLHAEAVKLNNFYTRNSLIKKKKQVEKIFEKQVEA